MDLREAIIQGHSEGFDKRADGMVNDTFLCNRTAWVNSVSNDYIMHGIPPTDSITKIASSNRLNSEQVQRIVEETNVNIYLKKYASTRGQKVRRVEFPLADPQVIMSSIEQVASTGGAEGENKMEKAASYNAGGTMVFGIPEKKSFDLFTDSALNYEPSMWEKDSIDKVASVYVKKRLEERQNASLAENAAVLRDAMTKIATVSDALIYNKRAVQDPQIIIDSLAKEASGDSSQTFELILKVADEHVRMLKSMDKLPGSFELDVVMPKTATSKFSLGNHSLLKEAEEQILNTNIALPEATDYKRLLKIVNNLNTIIGEGAPQEQVIQRVD